jgi:hypothetical protein
VLINIISVELNSCPYLCVNDESHAVLPAQLRTIGSNVARKLEKVPERSPGILPEGFSDLAAEASFCAKEGVQQVVFVYREFSLLVHHVQEVGVACKERHPY